MRLSLGSLSVLVAAGFVLQPAPAASAAEAAEAAEAVGKEGAEEVEDEAEESERESPVERAPAGGAETAEPPAAPAPQPAAGDRRRQRTIEEIVVTARKREESLIETPVSVTALDENALRDSGVKRLDQIERNVPNLTFQTDDGLTASVYIRGVGQASSLPTFDPGVGIYIDGVYLARPQGSVLDIVDVERIEVLRGPQGTLFGRNTAGGAINIITAKPDEEFGSSLSIRAGNRDRFDSRASVNVPIRVGALEDKLFFRASWASADDDGYSKDTARGERYNQRNMRAGMAALRFLPSEDLTVDFAGSYTYEKTTGRGTQCVQEIDAADLDILSRLLLGDLSVMNGGRDYLEECSRSQPFSFERDPDLDPLARLEAYGAWSTVTWDLGSPGGFDSLSVKSITSWREQKTRERFDVDGTSLYVGFNAAAGETEPKEGTEAAIFDGEGGDFTQYSQEFQLTGAALDGSLDFVAGLYTFYETSKLIESRRFFPGLLDFLGDPTRGIGAADCQGGTAVSETGTRNWSWALFGQATWDATDWLSLTGGLRRTKEYKRFQRFILNPFRPFCPVPMGEPPLSEVVLDADVDNRYDAWTPMAQVAVTLPDDWLLDGPLDYAMLYFNYGQGFKSGGFNGGILGIAEGSAGPGLTPFDEEKLDSYEIGIKSTWWERRISLNFGVYYSDYTDLQVNTIEALPAQPGELGSFLNVVRNAAEAEVIGAELELQARPAEGWLLTLSGGIQDTEYLEFPEGSSQLVARLPGMPAIDSEGVSCKEAPECDRAGESFNNVPKYQVNASIQYSFEVDLPGPHWLDGWITPRIEGYWQSRTHMTGPEVEGLRQDDYALMSARLSYDFNDDRSQIALWGENLFDKEYFTFGFATVTSLATAQRYYAEPRSYGVELSHTF